jgi:sec-independent protein translocase protein TatC
LARLKPVRYDDRLTIVEHLDELRTRIIVCVAVLVVAIALCFWQNNLLLDVANWPLPDGTVPITLSPTEPLMTTLTVSATAGLLLALPVILYQAFAFILPALSPAERRTVMPFAAAIPFLFIAGIVFAYYILMPVAVKFLLSFNETQFGIEVRARDYYSFLTVSLLAIGMLFQVPVVTLTLARLGIITPDQLARNRRYAVLAIAILGAVLTSPDPMTMLLVLLPVYLLYESSIQIARWFGRPREAFEASGEIATRDGPAPESGSAEA